MTSIEKLEWRYATKKFDSNKKLTEAQVEILKNAFNLTATSYGLQPLKMVVVNNKAIQNKIKPLAYNQDQVVDCSHLLVICMKTNIDGFYVDQRFDMEKEIRGVQEESIADFRAFLKSTIEKQSEEKIAESAKYQAYIALGNLMTICAFEGIDSCPMEGFIPSKLDEVLNLSEYNLKSVLLLPVGFRAEDDLMSTLKKVRSTLDDSIITME